MTDAVTAGLTQVAFDVASPARTYNWLLSGKDNFLADRILARQILEAVPDGHAIARANRHFVVRAVGHAAWSGVRQFVDLGCGLPACPDVQAVACPIVPDARIVYVDNDPLVIGHSQAKQSTAPASSRSVATSAHPSRSSRTRACALSTSPSRSWCC